MKGVLLTPRHFASQIVNQFEMLDVNKTFIEFQLNFFSNITNINPLFALHINAIKQQLLKTQKIISNLRDFYVRVSEKLISREMLWQINENLGISLGVLHAFHLNLLENFGQFIAKFIYSIPHLKQLEKIFYKADWQKDVLLMHLMRLNSFDDNYAISTKEKETYLLTLKSACQNLIDYISAKHSDITPYVLHYLFDPLFSNVYADQEYIILLERWHKTLTDFFEKNCKNGNQKTFFGFSKIFAIKHLLQNEKKYLFQSFYNNSNNSRLVYKALMVNILSDQTCLSCHGINQNYFIEKLKQSINKLETQIDSMEEQLQKYPKLFEYAVIGCRSWTESYYYKSTENYINYFLLGEHVAREKALREDVIPNEMLSEKYIKACILIGNGILACIDYGFVGSRAVAYAICSSLGNLLLPDPNFLIACGKQIGIAPRKIIRNFNSYLQFTLGFGCYLTFYYVMSSFNQESLPFLALSYLVAQVAKFSSGSMLDLIYSYFHGNKTNKTKQELLDNHIQNMTFELWRKQPVQHIVSLLTQKYFVPTIYPLAQQAASLFFKLPNNHTMLGNDNNSQLDVATISTNVIVDY